VQFLDGNPIGRSQHPVHRSQHPKLTQLTRNYWVEFYRLGVMQNTFYLECYISFLVLHDIACSTFQKCKIRSLVLSIDIYEDSNKSIFHLNRKYFKKMTPALTHLLLFLLFPNAAAFFSPIRVSNHLILTGERKQLSNTAIRNELHQISDPDQEPVPFLDLTTNTFIECYIDAVAKLEDVEYTIGVPCDHAVLLCYFDEDEQLTPIELDDELMNDVFPVAESIVAEEFGEELVLQRTPQTLTLVGELDEIDDEDEDDDDDNDDDESDDEQVEVLLSFEHRDREFNLVRLMDPVLLVGKEIVAGQRVLLSPEESEKVMPQLEQLILDMDE
jgi:Protein of unknown function (DUF3727)